MIKFLYTLAQIIMIVALALWLADSPGSARIVWHDTVIETSAAFLVLGILLLAYIFHVLFRLWHFLRYGPIRWRLHRRLYKSRKSHDQIIQGLVAIASGNAGDAGRLAVALRKSGDNQIVAFWLQAQAAQLAGDATAAREIFRKLAAQPQAAALGYRGLITAAKEQNQWDEVDHLLAELRRVKLITPWFSLIAMENAARRGQWTEAEAALSHVLAGRLLNPDKARRVRAILRIAVSRQAAAAGDENAARQAAEQAARHAPDFMPALINLAERLAASDHRRAAERVIERAWKIQPHRQLTQILRGLFPDPLQAFKNIERLCRAHPATIESHIALAQAALNADIWGEARRHLSAALATGQATQSVYTMLANLERRQHGDERAALNWLIKMTEAAPDPVWRCHTCGNTHAAWQAVCDACGAFDSLEWHNGT